MIDDYAIKIEIETVQCSFLRFRPSGDRVLLLSMRYASLAPPGEGGKRSKRSE